MIDYPELRIYPSKKHILVFTNTSNNNKFRDSVEALIADNNEFIDSSVDEIYEQIRTLISSNNAFCLVKDKETNAIFIYEYNLDANFSFKIAGFDEEGKPYLELLN